MDYNRYFTEFNQRTRKLLKITWEVKQDIDVTGRSQIDQGTRLLKESTAAPEKACSSGASIRLFWPAVERNASPFRLCAWLALNSITHVTWELRQSTLPLERAEFLTTFIEKVIKNLTTLPGPPKNLGLGLQPLISAAYAREWHVTLRLITPFANDSNNPVVIIRPP